MRIRILALLTVVEMGLFCVVGEHQRSPGIDPKQLAAELQKVSQQQAPASVLSALERAGHLHSGTGSAASSGVPSPGQPGSPSVNKKRHSSKVLYV